MSSDAKKKYQLEDILSDNVSIMDMEDLTYEGTPPPVDEEAGEGFCVECKDQQVNIFFFAVIAIIAYVYINAVCI